MDANRHVIDQTYVLSYDNPAANNPWLDLNVALTYSDTDNSQGKSDSPFATNPATPGSFGILFPTDYAYRTLQLKQTRHNRLRMQRPTTTRCS